MFLFKKKPKIHLGIDIGTSAIKLVELEKKEERYQLKTYGIFPITEYLKHLHQRVHLETPKLSDEQIAEMIKRTIQEAKAEARTVCLSVPVYSSFSTLINLPPMSEKEVSAAIPFEAKKYIPVPISEVILDWSIIRKTEGQTSETKEERTKSEGRQILLVAVPKDVVAKYTRIAQLANLRLRAIEAETFSLARCLVGNDKSAIVLVDTGARSSNISIIDQGYVRVTHNLEIGGTELTERISQNMNISLEEAEELKKTGQAQKFELEEITHSVLDIIINEIKKIVNHYQTKYNRKIEKCILVGGGIGLPGLVDYFTPKLGLEVSIGNPFARVVYLSILEPVIKELGPSLAVATGLAMRE
jgi:type IV pilus assembly protein PilM